MPVTLSAEVLGLKDTLVVVLLREQHEPPMQQNHTRIEMIIAATPTAPKAAPDIVTANRMWLPGLEDDIFVGGFIFELASVVVTSVWYTGR